VSNWDQKTKGRYDQGFPDLKLKTRIAIFPKASRVIEEESYLLKDDSSIGLKRTRKSAKAGKNRSL